MGYNHNLKHSGRHYHVQTEDSGSRAPHIFTHLFCSGSIIASSRSDYGALLNQEDLEGQLKQLMRDQHKAMMRRLVRGELDAKIVEILGSLEPERQPGKVRRYHHRFEHHQRAYSVSTSFFSNVVSEVFWEGVLIACEREALAERLLPGGPEIQQRAQQLHKQMLRGLRDGRFDDKIVSLLGALDPPAAPKAEVGEAAISALARVLTNEGTLDTAVAETQEATAEVYNHRLRRDERNFDFQTRLFYGQQPYAISEVLLGETVLTSQRLECADPSALRSEARALHKQLMRELRDGGLDETIELLDELMDEEDALLPC